MSKNNTYNDRIEQEKDKVIEDLQRQPNLFLSLAENALTVAESLRNNYFQNTAQFVARLRITMRDAIQKGNREPVLKVFQVENATWETVQNEVVTFIDAGVGQAQISNQVPVLLRVGSYCVRVGERRLAEREKFGYYPVILGDLEGGSKDRRDFIDIVRITAELLGGLSALERTPDLRILMFHGPLVYVMSGYAGHTPFTERDIDLFLHHYTSDPDVASQIKEDFLHQAKLDIYPNMTESFPELVKQRLFEPLAWIAYLYRRLIQVAQQRKPVPIIAGAVERGRLSEFSERVLLRRIFRRLHEKEQLDYLNKIYNRSDLNTPKAFLSRLGYTDALLLALLLQPGQFSEPWIIGNKYENFSKGYVVLPGESRQTNVDWQLLKSSKEFGFPAVKGCYIQVSENNEPIRVEVFDALGKDQINEAARRIHLYSRLLPEYSFPVGLDIVDKYAKVPNWMTDAYSKLIRHHLGVSLQSGEISDAEMRRILVQAIYMTHRDWLFRPHS